MTKPCNLCKQMLPLDKFYVDLRAKRNRHYTTCMDCWTGRARRKYVERRVELCKRANERRGMRLNGLATRFLLTPEEKKRRMESGRMKRLYGVSLEEYEALAGEADNKCQICSKKFKRRLSVDHCHKSGKMRGLLCHQCNVGLGFFMDDMTILNKASMYLGRYL